MSLVEVLFKETLPAIIMDINKHYQSLLLPSKDLASDMATLKGDILILGVGGKMGPALARLAKQAVDVAGVKKRIIGVSRFSEAGLQDELNSLGIETYKADLLQDDQLTHYLTLRMYSTWPVQNSVLPEGNLLPGL